MLAVALGSSVKCVACDDECLVVYCGLYNSDIAVIDVAAKCVTHTLEGHAYSVWAVLLNPQTTTLFSASTDKTVRAWDTNTRQQLWAAKCAGWVHSLAIRNNTVFAGVTRSNAIAIDAATGNTLRGYAASKGQVLGIAVFGSLSSL